MAAVTVTAEKWRIDKYVKNGQTETKTPGSWTDVSGSYGHIFEGFWGSEWRVCNMAYRLPAASTLGTISSLTLNLTVMSVSTSAELRIYLFDSAPTNFYFPNEASFVAVATRSVSTSSGSLSVTFSGLSIDATKKLYICVCPHHLNDLAPLELNILETATASVNISYPALSFTIAPTTLTTQETADIAFENRLGQSVGLRFTENSSGRQLATATATADTYTVQPSIEWFLTAGVSGMQMTVKVTADDGLRPSTYRTFTLKKPELDFTFEKTSIGTGEEQTITFSGRLGQTLTLTFDVGGVPVASWITAIEDSVSFTPTNAWFANLGSATSASVNVTATDSGWNRSAKHSFQLKKAATVTNVSPASSASVTATDEMTWTWSVTGGTTQKRADVYVNGTKIGTVEGSQTSLTSNYHPAPGYVSWYVVVTNNLDVVSSSTATSYMISYSGQSMLVPVNTTISGYILRKKANTFTVEILTDPDHGTPYQDYTLSSPVFYWKKSTDNTWTSVNMTRSADHKSAYTTRAANYFPAAEIQWYVQATDSDGQTRTTPTYTIDTNAAPITATPTEPIDTIENANTETVFRWIDSSPVESAQQAAQLQYSYDGSTWSSLGSVSGSATSCPVPANTLNAGTVYWRVRAQNTDSSWGAWSTAVSFVNFGAPVITNVTADGRPRATISWTVQYQQAYRVTVDGTVYGPFFGADVFSYQIPDYLADGAHTVTVEAQNAYGQWSVPASTVFTVTNVPGADTVTLGGVFRRDAELEWASDAASQEFLVFRDGRRVAHVRGYEFVDRTVLGWHEWFVLLPLAGGYYVKSNTIAGTLQTSTIAIAPLAGGEWLDLARSTNSGRTVTYNLSQTVSMRQFVGEIWPRAEAAPYRALSVNFDAAWSREDKAGADAFAELIGKAVIWKDCEGAFIGILSAWTRNNSIFYRAYNASIQRIHWEDFIDADS